MKQIFRLHLIGKAALAVLLLTPAAFLTLPIVLWLAPDIPVTQKVMVSILALIIASPFLWLAVVQRRSRIEITSEHISISIPLFGRSIPTDRLIQQSVCRLTMQDPRGYRLKWRTIGLSVPGYQLGWFRSAGEGKVLAAISGNDLIAFKTVDDFSIVVSPRDCDGLIVTLRDRLLAADAP